MAAVLKILIVEDNVDDSDLLLRHLKKEGYETRHERVETESSMDSALEKNDWDTIICDYHLPAFGAFSALSVARKKAPHVPFIILSGSMSEEDAVKALKAGANDYILKHNMTRLVPAIERELIEAKGRQERAQVEATLKKKEEELRQAQKLESVGQLAGGIAHDFNNILAIILMQADSMMEEIEENPALKKVAESIYKGLEQIKKSGFRASHLTRQLLAFSRKQVIQAKVLNLNDVIPDMEKMLRHLIEENIDFKIQLAPGLKNIKVDPGYLEQVIMNLVVNSRDAMPQGGVLCIETQNSSISEETAQQYNSKAGNYVLLKVSDTGLGMDKEVQKHIFDPFFTTKDIGKGTGLGLSTVYGIVKQSKGLIFVKSAPEKGTIFEIYFPEVEDTITPKPTDAPTAKAATGSETILVVEDEETLREVVSGLLVKNGYQVLEASNGIEALKVLHTAKSPISLIITDVVMPQMGGQKFAESVRNLNVKTQFLFLSGYTDDVLIQQGLNMGQINFLTKPYTSKVLLEKIRSILGR